MTKAITIDPLEMRRPGALRFADIPVNAYQKTVKDELGRYTPQTLLALYSDMRTIRAFETMLNNIKTLGEHAGVRYSHPGPAHLGIGQEAVYVGAAYHLTKDDCSFGSHRSHGEILAKSLRLMRTLPEPELQRILESFAAGTLLKAVECGKSLRETALDFLLYGMISEVFGKAAGFNKGMGGSMHAFFTPFGIFPNNAIVGGSGTLSVGAALFKRVNHKKGIVVCNIGDGATACGPVWEGLMISAMDQVRTLWPKEQSGANGVPLLFHINDNFYGMGGQTFGETMGFQMAARIAAGVSPTQLHTERVDGYNPLAVLDAYERKLPVVKQDGPVLLDIVTYRLGAHSASDAGSYRTQEEVAAWREMDPIASFGAQLIDAGVCTEKELTAMTEKAEADVLRGLAMAADPKLSPRVDIHGSERSFIEAHMFSNERVRSMEPARRAETLCALEESPRFLQMEKKVRFAFDESGAPISKNRLYQVRDALAEPILHKFYEDATLVAFGEEVRDWGGAFAVYRGFTETLPYHRLFNTPIAEAGIVGTAVGYAMSGGRAVAELMYCDFMGRAGDEIFNQLSKWQAMSAGLLRMPVVLRMSVGSKYGAQHSQDWSAMCAHIPGLKVVFPVTPYDAKGLMQAALNGTDPVLFLESQRVYDRGEEFHAGGVPKEEYELAFGEPDIKRAGTDITILTIGAALYRALEAADILSQQYGLSAEIIDARSLVPFNYEPVLQSVQKTGRILITGDASERGSFMRNFASNITELCFDYLDAPPAVVGARNWITPPHELEDSFFPQPGWLIDAIHERLLPLPGHVAAQSCTEQEQIRRNKLGV